MKSIVVIASVVMLASRYASALPVSNPGDATLLKKGHLLESLPMPFLRDVAVRLRTCYGGDFVFERHLEIGDDDKSGFGKKLQKVELFTQSGSLVLNFCNWVDLIAGIGTTRFRTSQNTALILPDAPGFESHAEWASSLSWQAGFRATLWKCKGILVGTSMHYFGSKAELDHLIIGGPLFHFGKIYLDRFETQYKEWQVSLGATWVLDRENYLFAPYLAVKYAAVHWDFAKVNRYPSLEGSLFSDLHAQKRWGAVLGFSFILLKSSEICLERRFGDENAFYATLQLCI